MTTFYHLYIRVGGKSGFADPLPPRRGVGGGAASSRYKSYHIAVNSSVHKELQLKLRFHDSPVPSKDPLLYLYTYEIRICK